MHSAIGGVGGILALLMTFLSGTQFITAPQRGFYGWRMVVFASIAFALTGPGQTAGISVFVDPLVTDLDITRTQLTTAYMIGTLTAALALPWIGRAMDSFGVRKVMIATGLVFGGALMALSAVSGIAGLTGGFVLLRMSGQGALSMAATTVIAAWFIRRRGLVIGIVSAVGSIGITLTPLVSNWLIGRSGWRYTWFVEGVVVLAVIIPMSLLLIRNRPSDVGQLPDGEPPARGMSPEVVGLTLRQVRGTVLFWLIMGAVALTAGLVTAVSFHQIGILTARGLTPTAAAANFLPQIVATLLAMFVIGALADRVSARWLICSAMLALAAGLALAAFVVPGVTAIAFGMLIGASAGATRVVESAEIPRHFGIAHLGSIRGWVVAVSVAASAVGPLAFSIVQSATGSYTAVLLGSAVLPIVIVVIALFARSAGMGQTSLVYPAPI